MFNEFCGNVTKPGCAAPKFKLVQKGEEDIINSNFCNLLQHDTLDFIVRIETISTVRFL